MEKLPPYQLPKSIPVAVEIAWHAIPFIVATIEKYVKQFEKQDDAVIDYIIKGAWSRCGMQRIGRRTFFAPSSNPIDVNNALNAGKQLLQPLSQNAVC